MLTILALCGVTSCGLFGPAIADLPVQTRFALLNFSKRHYAALEVRQHTDPPGATTFTRMPLLPPGAVLRTDFYDLVGDTCPASLDFRLLLYRRVNDDASPPIPIGLDEGEEVEAVPIVAGQIENVPGPCAGFQPVGIYTVANWDAPEGDARVKFAQDSDVDQLIRASGRFANADAAWEIAGVNADMADREPPSPLAVSRIVGHVRLADGTGVEGIGVMLRTRFRVRLDDSSPDNDPDAGYGDPIMYTITDASGEFSFERPPGVYQIQVFSDEFAFRPSIVEVESPLENVWIVAEPL